MKRLATEMLPAFFLLILHVRSRNYGYQSANLPILAERHRPISFFQRGILDSTHFLNKLLRIGLTWFALSPILKTRAAVESGYSAS
jgi:hypothetical protein